MVLHLCKAGSAEGESDRQHSGHGDGDATHDDDQHVGERRALLCARKRKLKRSAFCTQPLEILNRQLLYPLLHQSPLSSEMRAQASQDDIRQEWRTLAQVARVVVVAKLHAQLDDAPGEDGDQADAADARHDLLDVGHVVGALLACTSRVGWLAGYALCCWEVIACVALLLLWLLHPPPKLGHSQVPEKSLLMCDEKRVMW